MLTHHRQRSKQNNYLIIGLALTIQSLCVFSAPIGIDGARHLLSRTGFGSASPIDIQRFAPLERAEAVDKLIAENSKILPIREPNPDILVFQGKSELNQLTEAEKREHRATRRQHGQDLKAWWIQQLLSTQQPLRENLTLFWHGHFTSSLKKVNQPRWMYQQNQLFRAQAFGNFAQLLHSVAKDPAMLSYLDGAKSKLTKPNENFARELLELYTLGEGHYTEQDIQALATRFTGWTIDPEYGEFRLNTRQQNTNPLTIFGKTGPWNGDEAIDLILAKPETAEWITGKLWAHFVSPNLDQTVIRRLAKPFAKDYELKPLIRSILLSDAFWSPKQQGSLVKSPVDVIIGTLRLYAPPLPAETQSKEISKLLSRLGQDLLDPPTVRGWPGGNQWINTNTLTIRQNWLTTLGKGKADKTHDKLVLPSLPVSSSDYSVTIGNWLLPSISQLQLTSPPTIQAVFTDPAYQLK